MEYRLQEAPGLLIVHLKGDVDLQYSPKLRRVLMDGLQQRRHVLVDLQGVDMVDSSALACFLEAAKGAKGAGLTFFLCAPTEQTLRVISLAKLETVLPIEADLTTARAKLPDISGA